MMTIKPALDFSRYLRLVDASEPYLALGAVTEMVGLLIESSGPATALGDFCEIQTSQGRIVRVQVIGFRNGNLLSMALEEIDGLKLARSARAANCIFQHTTGGNGSCWRASFA